MPRSHDLYEYFKNDRYRLFALISRDVRIVLVAAVLGSASFAGEHPALRSLVMGWVT